MSTPHPQMAKRLEAVNRDIMRLSEAIAMHIVNNQGIKDDILNENLINTRKYYNLHFSLYFGNRSEEFGISFGDKPGAKKQLIVPGLREQMKYLAANETAKITGGFTVRENKPEPPKPIAARFRGHQFKIIEGK